MATYTYAQLEQLWINNGGSKTTAPIAAAIAEAESGGNPASNNYNDNNGTQTSWGLWQISNGTHAMPVPNINDPNVNAQQAVAKYNASGWEPWGTYTSGAYTAYLSGSTPPDPNVPATLTADTTSGQGGAPAGGSCLVGPVFGFCILDKSQARALIGGLLITAGALIILPGIIVLVAAGFQKTGAPGAVNAAAAPLERTPGYGHAIRAARSRGSRPAASPRAAAPRRAAPAAPRPASPQRSQPRDSGPFRSAGGEFRYATPQ